MSVNVTSTSVCYSDSDSSATRVAELVATIIITLLSVLGNSLIIYIVYVEPRATRKNINYFLANAAAADLIFVGAHGTTQYIVPLLLNTFAWIPRGLTGDWVCKIVSFVVDVPLLVTPLTMVLISIERHRATKSFLRTAGMTRHVRILSLALSWAIPCAKCMPVLWYVESVKRADGTSYCIWMTSPLPKWYILLIVFTTGLEGMAVVVINLCTVKKLHNHVLPSGFPGGQRKTRESRIRNAVRMVFCSVLTYSLLVSPFYIYYAVFHLNRVIYTTSCADRRKLSFLFSFLLYANTALGPFVYLKFIYEFRARLRSLISRVDKRVILASNRVVSFRQTRTISTDLGNSMENNSTLN
ncbi:galanin receptor type 3 [Nematostella vectensis]|uniref:galanin receptor type 3 n=1 Tax=Nematostella vectensis TaxID=45351 RepID=UPI0020772063|nr:galanin receptor type 3 [Nematostella vectensis]